MSTKEFVYGGDFGGMVTGKLCMAQRPKPTYYCSREEGHSGPHVAAYSHAEKIVDVWSGSPIWEEL